MSDSDDLDLNRDEFGFSLPSSAKTKKRKRNSTIFEKQSDIVSSGDESGHESSPRRLGSVGKEKMRVQKESNQKSGESVVANFAPIPPRHSMVRNFEPVPCRESMSLEKLTHFLHTVVCVPSPCLHQVAQQLFESCVVTEDTICELTKQMQISSNPPIDLPLGAKLALSKWASQFSTTHEIQTHQCELKTKIDNLTVQVKRLNEIICGNEHKQALRQKEVTTPLDLPVSKNLPKHNLQTGKSRKAQLTLAPQQNENESENESEYEGNSLQENGSGKDGDVGPTLENQSPAVARLPAGLIPNLCVSALHELGGGPASLSSVFQKIQSQCLPVNISEKHVRKCFEKYAGSYRSSSAFSKWFAKNKKGEILLTPKAPAVGTMSQICENFLCGKVELKKQETAKPEVNPSTYTVGQGVIQIAQKVLHKAEKPMTSGELAEEALRQGLVKGNSQIWARKLGSWIAAHRSKNGDSLFVKCDEGYGLSEWKL